MSKHAIRIIEINEVRPHDNADRLCIVPVGGWSCVVGKEQFKPGSRAIYIEPDYVVPLDREEFAFLRKPDSDKVEHRLKAIRLRGVISFGLLIPVPGFLANRAVNDNVMDDLGIRRYEPPVQEAGADDLPFEEWPKVYASKFDVENLANHEDILERGEEVLVTEKIHGANARYVFSNDVFYMGSRTRWLKPVNHIWKRAADGAPEIEAWCRSNPDDVLYGEVFGSVQELKYGRDKGKVSFAAFAASRCGDWIDVPLLRADMQLHGVPVAPLLYQGPFDRETIAALAERDSEVYGCPQGHMMEGVVIVPFVEHRHDKIGRVALKLISNRYWLS